MDSYLPPPFLIKAHSELKGLIAHASPLGPSSSHSNNLNKRTVIAITTLLLAPLTAQEKFPSPVPRQVFSGTLADQQQELTTNGQMQRFAA